jgi:hypothetical protein
MLGQLKWNTLSNGLPVISQNRTIYYSPSLRLFELIWSIFLIAVVNFKQLTFIFILNNFIRVLVYKVSDKNWNFFS